MNYRARLGNSSTASGSSEHAVGSLEQLIRPLGLVSIFLPSFFNLLFPYMFHELQVSLLLLKVLGASFIAGA